MGGGAYEPKKIGKPVKTGLGPSKCSASKGRNINIKKSNQYSYKKPDYIFVYVKNIVYLGY